MAGQSGKGTSRQEQTGHPAGFIQDKRISWGLLPPFRETLWGIVWVMNFLPKRKKGLEIYLSP
jgi:hypothetical protein